MLRDIGPPVILSFTAAMILENFGRPGCAQYNCNLKMIQFFVEIKAMSKLSGLRHKRLTYSRYHKEKICGNLRNLRISSGILKIHTGCMMEKYIINPIFLLTT